MEELLNKLIEKGWKPFGESRIDKINRAEQYVGNRNWCCWGSKDAIQKRKSTRELVSKESGLWQFCVENGMIDGVDRWTLNARQKSIYDKYITSEKEYTPKMNYEYRLIESALTDEDKLEEFLLNNIKIDE